MTTSHRILDISLRNLSIFQEGTYAYKALLEVQCDAANLDFEIDGNGLKREADGKIYTEVWNVSGGKENVFNCNNNGILKIHLTKSIISSPIYLHTTILELDDFNDEFVVNCHGKVLLHPRKRLFDANKTMVSTEHTMKLKLASLLEQEMVQVVCGWLEIVVITNVNTEEPHHVEDAFKVNESIAEEPSDQNQTKEPGIKLKLAPNVATIVKETEDRNDSPVAGLAIEKSYFHLPDMNAVREILPKYHELSSKSESFRRRKPSVQPHVPIEEPDQSEFEEQLKTTNENTNDQLRKGGVNDILVYQAQELEKYHTIVEQMGKDINSLHKQVANLKHDKSQLSYQLTLVRSSHVEENDENSLLGQLREQLVSENSDKLELQQRVANLQNQMIKKNEIEEDYLKLQTAHEEQQRTIHDSQNKLKKLKRLEELCSEQENVLQVMEKKLAEDGIATKMMQTAASKKFDPKVAMVAETIESIDERLKLIVELEHAHNTIKALREHNEVNARATGNGKAYMENKRLMYHYGNNNSHVHRPMLTNVPRDLPVTLPTHWRSGDDPTSFDNFSKYSYNHMKGENVYRKDTYPY